MVLFLTLLLVSVYGQSCTLLVPPHPRTAQGLATPYILSGVGCTQTSPNGRTFVEAAILDKSTGAITIYHPLVIDAGTTPAVAPVLPVLPQFHSIGIWFGSNAGTVTLTGAAAVNCTNGNGAQGGVFGQFAYCHAKQFFKQANILIAAGKLVVPPIGMGQDGKPCPTTRDFRLVDQDQSDNLETNYLLFNGQTAQNNAANRAALVGATEIDNGSDNRLLGHFFGPALGCTPFMAPSLVDPGTMINALALNELSAAANQQAPQALVPINDPMVLNLLGNPDLVKDNLYRFGVNQPPATVANDAAPDMPDNASGLHYCQNLIKGITAFNLPATMTLLLAFKTPDPATGNNLFNFLAARSSASLQLLNCLNLLNIVQPWKLTVDGNGVVIAAVFNPPGGVVSTTSTTSVASSTSSTTSVATSTSSTVASMSSSTTVVTTSSSSAPVTTTTSTSTSSTSQSSSGGGTPSIKINNVSTTPTATSTSSSSTSSSVSSTSTSTSSSSSTSTSVSSTSIPQCTFPSPTTSISATSSSTTSTTTSTSSSASQTTSSTASGAAPSIKINQVSTTPTSSSSSTSTSVSATTSSSTATSSSSTSSSTTSSSTSITPSTTSSSSTSTSIAPTTSSSSSTSITPTTTTSSSTSTSIAPTTTTSSSTSTSIASTTTTSSSTSTSIASTTTTSSSTTSISTTSTSASLPTCTTPPPLPVCVLPTSTSTPTPTPMTKKKRHIPTIMKREFRKVPRRVRRSYY